MRDLLVGILLAILPATATAQFCPTCIQNSAAPQNAQMNIGTATIRGTLTVNQLVAAALSLGSVTAATFTGDGSNLTILNAAQLSSGTVPSARLSGAYSGVSGVGTLASGTWQGTPVGTQYGGTGKNWVNVSTGSIPYFSSVGTMTTLSPGDPQALLQTNGSAAPVWTSSPAVSGIHIYGINPSQLAAGTLPTSVIVTSNSIPYVAGASVIGNISGAAGSYTGPIALSQLAVGIIPSATTASSITVTGVKAGTYGGPSIAAQYTVGTDGRLSYSTQAAIAILPSQISTGTWPAGVFIPAANITSGTLAGNVVASSIAASGVTPGTYGGPTIAAQITIGGDGRVTSATQFNLGGISTHTAFNNVDNNWSHAQTSQSSWSVLAPLVTVGSSAYIASQSSITTTSGLFGDSLAVTHGANLATSGGKVGIGTTSPGATLDVGGNAQFGTTTKSTFATTGELSFPNNVGITATNSGGNGFSMIRMTNGDTVRIQTDSPGNKVTIGGNPGVTATFVNGSVGISTGIPQATLDVNGNELVRGNIVLTSSISLAAGQQVLVGSNANCGTTPGLCVDELTSGNVAFLRNGNGAQLRLLNGTGPDVGIYMAAQDNSSANNSLNINFSGTHLFTVANDGKVGVGVLGNAATLLDVTGNAQFGSGVGKSTFSATGALTLANGAALTLSGSAGTITSGSSVTAGAFYGYGGNLSGVTASAVPASGVQAGTLGPAVIASSVAATGVTASTYGSATQAPQIVVAGDGRITSASNVTVTPAAASITAGSLGATVIASSIAANGVVAGTYGSATQVSQVTVGGDGRVTTASNVTITGVPAATVPASGVQAGTLGATVIASSVAATGVVAGSYGTATAAPSYTVAGDGRLTASGSNTITPAAGSITSGTLGAAVIASSVAASGVTAGSYGSASSVGTFTVGGDGRLSAASNTSIAIAESAVTNLVSDLATKASTGTDNSMTRAQALKTIDGPLTVSSTMTVLATIQSTAAYVSGNSYVAGVPSFALNQTAKMGTHLFWQGDASNNYFYSGGSGGWHIENSGNTAELWGITDAGVMTHTFDFGNNITYLTGGHNFMQGDANFTYLYGGPSGINFRSTDNSASLGTLANTGTLAMVYGVTASSFAISGSTLTAGTSGIVSAGSQPGARSRQVADEALASTVVEKLFFGDNACANGCFNQNNVWGGSSSSGTFTTRGAGTYDIQCQVVFTGALATTLLSIYIADDTANDTVFGNEQAAAGSTNTTVLTAVSLNTKLADGQNIQCNARADSVGVNAAGSLSTFLSIQKKW